MQDWDTPQVWKIPRWRWVSDIREAMFWNKKASKDRGVEEDRISMLRRRLSRAWETGDLETFTDANRELEKYVRDAGFPVRGVRYHAAQQKRREEEKKK
jgi:hypothetical protein